MNILLSTSSNLAKIAISILVLILRPSSTTFLPYFSQDLMIAVKRSNCEAKVPIIRRPVEFLIILSSVSNTAPSGAEKPSRSALVESQIRTRFLFWPTFSQSAFSSGTTSPFSWVRRMSPVITTSPCLVSTDTPIASGMEWVTGKVFIFVFPTVKESPSFTMCMSSGSR